MKFVIIDNYDSYTYNLFQLIAKVTQEIPLVIKNDQMSYDEFQQLDFDAIVISPGPGNPQNPLDFGLCREVIEKQERPILGICLGQQGIYYLNGGENILAPQPVHGRLSEIRHNNQGLFKDLPQDFKVTRYHSLVCKEEDLENIQIDARTHDGLIMGISHRSKPQYAVQFHPESIASQEGEQLIVNFIHIVKAYQAQSLPIFIEKQAFTRTSQMVFDQLYQMNKQTHWLDSSQVTEGMSRFSIIAQAGPYHGHRLEYSVTTNQIVKKDQTGKEVLIQQDIFTYLEQNQPRWSVHPDLPFDFQLGYIGYFGYELKSLTEGPNQHQSPYPDVILDYIDRAVIIDHLENQLYFLSYKDDKDWLKDLDFSKVYTSAIEKEDPVMEAFDQPTIAWAMDRRDYLKAIHQCQDYIRQGESYEICLTNRLDVEDQLDAYKYYQALRQASPAPYAAFLTFDDFAVACSSMEKFLTLDRNGRVQTKPIKGTAKRGQTPAEDQAIIHALATEEKTMAENLMIVDLLRNDLGKVCQIGTVSVPKLMAVESYSTLHQLVTTVQGFLAKNVTPIELFKACFPGGSMTGAPKYRTLELIDQLEGRPRGIYSGAIGYIANNGCMDLNIVIRTAVIEEEKTSIGLGGAIIALSDPEEEYQETLVKAQGALNALKTYYHLPSNYQFKIKGA
ncbi:aminodeoxychorismate synthase component I [Facklamia miroungae]|uniref:aminodeoxychorismate synthase n=1 Tax=Facklamia miroungae TaxID=120956 RepID=A0A1G7RW25_9LACT|nr:aminodeoxychorismate synthase component I [Facklamia miroungae]NKZ29270.1 aminodeoxychorismate synthase component I [Facklamia miroungae]SDG14419.1 para-aminobenzoate synthetase [Facklamia miroungae]